MITIMITAIIITIMGDANANAAAICDGGGALSSWASSTRDRKSTSLMER